MDPITASAHLTEPQTFDRRVYARNNPLWYVGRLGLGPTEHDESGGN